MSLPPVQWAEAAIQAPRARSRQASVDLILAMIWGARNGGIREPFKAALTTTDLQPHWTQSEDGWSAPLWRLPPPPGATGEPVIIAPGAGLGPRSVDLSAERSLVRFLHARGFDVYIFSHRGCADARRPNGPCIIDFDSIVRHDVPAALAMVKAISGAERVHWVGHGLGGQCLVGHIASDGEEDIAAGVLMSTPVRFKSLKTTARRVAAVARHLPADWQIPNRMIQEILTVASRQSDLSRLTRRMEGPMARAMLTEATADLPLGLIQQVAQWHSTGQLTDRGNRFDYLEGLSGRRSRILVMASPDDALCSLDAARPVFEKLAPGAGEWLTLAPGWGHLDLLAGADADRVVFPPLTDWLEEQQDRCWTGR
jgi:polyhydroxyalkanoate synthase subunit PhaC